MKRKFYSAISFLKKINALSIYLRVAVFILFIIGILSVFSHNEPQVTTDSNNTTSEVLPLVENNTAEVLPADSVNIGPTDNISSPSSTQLNSASSTSARTTRAANAENEHRAFENQGLILSSTALTLPKISETNYDGSATLTITSKSGAITRPVAKNYSKTFALLTKDIYVAPSTLRYS